MAIADVLLPCAVSGLDFGLLSRAIVTRAS
jgi:hypothetical protein